MVDHFEDGKGLIVNDLMMLAHDSRDITMLLFLFVMVIIASVLAAIMHTYARRRERQQHAREIDSLDPMDVALGKRRDSSQDDAAKRQATIDKVEKMVSKGLPATLCQKCGGLGRTTLGMRCSFCGGHGYVETSDQ